MPKKLAQETAMGQAYHHPVVHRELNRQPMALNGKKLNDKKPKNSTKSVYSHTLNNYESIRNLVTLQSGGSNDTQPTDVDKKRVHIKV